jgi:non-ribosomal peptide synthetase component F
VRDRTPPGDVLVPTLALRIERDRGESRLGMVRRNLPKSVAAAAAHRAASEGGSLFQWMVLALALALDPIREPGPFGVVVPIANRDHPDAAPLVGWLSSLGCIRLRLNWSQGLSGMATQVRQALAVASATAALPVRIVEEHLAGDIPVSPRPRVYFDYVAADPTAVVLDRVRLDEIEAPATPYLMPGLSFWATKNVDGSIGLLLCFDLGRLSESDAEAILECFELALAASCGKGDGDLDGLRGAMSAVIHKAGSGLVVDSGGGSRNS